VRRVVVPILLILLALPLSAAKRRSRTKPPADLHRVGDHWTAYDPPDPASFPAGSKTHTIVRGDTLWDLATKYYGNAYLWPQLWEANTYIRDAHWIYPGDPLLLQGDAAAAAGDMSTTAVTQETGFTEDGSPMTDPSAGMTAQMGPMSSPIPLATEADLYCWGYIGDPGEPMPNHIMGFEDVETKFVPGAMNQGTGVGTDEVVFINGGTSTGIQPGETYMVIMPEKLVKHPKTDELLGRHYEYRGQVRILCATEETATALVTKACDDIHIGDRLKPMPRIPIPLARLTPMKNVCSSPSGKSAGFIVNSKDYRFALGQGTLVQVNLGRDEFVEPGDFLTVYRESPVDGTPPLVLGEVAILTSDAHTSTGRIIRMRYAMTVGDRVELK